VFTVFVRYYIVLCTCQNYLRNKVYHVTVIVTVVTQMNKKPKHASTHTTYISGNFCVVKFLCFNISCNNIFVDLYYPRNCFMVDDL